MGSLLQAGSLHGPKHVEIPVSFSHFVSKLLHYFMWLVLFHGMQAHESLLQLVVALQKRAVLCWKVVQTAGVCCARVSPSR